MANMKIKAKEKNGVVHAKVQITHEMMTYNSAKEKSIEEMMNYFSLA